MEKARKIQRQRIVPQGGLRVERSSEEQLEHAIARLNEISKQEVAKKNKAHSHLNWRYVPLDNWNQLTQQSPRLRYSAQFKIVAIRTASNTCLIDRGAVTEMINSRRHRPISALKIKQTRSFQEERSSGSIHPERPKNQSPRDQTERCLLGYTFVMHQTCLLPIRTRDNCVHINIILPVAVGGGGVMIK